MFSLVEAVEITADFNFGERHLLIALKRKNSPTPKPLNTFEFLD
jgi:hypothetical protein